MVLSAWQERLRTAAASRRPFIENEAAYYRMRNQGWEFDSNLTPIRGIDRNYAVGALARGWWCFYFPSHAQKMGNPHPFAPWGSSIAAAIRKERTTGYAGNALPGISFTMNLLPFLPDGVEAVKRIINSFDASTRHILRESWGDIIRPCYDEIADIVCWRQDGEGTIEVSPKEAVRIIDEALGSMSPGAANNAPRREAMKEPQEKVTTVDLGDTATIWPIRTRPKDGAMIYGVAPDDKAATEWGIPPEAVTFIKRMDGKGRLRIYEGDKEHLDTSKVSALAGKFVKIHGQTGIAKWVRKPRRIVVQFDADQTAAIVGA